MWLGDRGNTFRAVPIVRLADRVYVLHAFQKKAKHGIATPQTEMDLIKRRVKQAVAISEGRGLTPWPPVSRSLR